MILFDAGPDPVFHFDADPDPNSAFHFDADPDPASPNDADPCGSQYVSQLLLVWLFRYPVLGSCNLLDFLTP